MASVRHSSRVSGSSPHTRGARVAGLPGRRQRGIIPAYAGSTGLTSSGGASRKGSSPHTRGALDLMTHFTYWKRIIPAYAGSTRIESRAMSSHGDHPRIRGEHTNDAQMEAFSAGSSPHTRGALHTQPSESGPTRIIPAYAGSTWCRWCAIRPGWDHPRIRGEHPPGDTAWGLLPGSSPHTRGARGVAAVMCGSEGIIPAYAGSTNPWTLVSSSARDHPRIRGEHFRQRIFVRSRHGSSPHTRGAHLRQGSHRSVPGIIPAYAGSTI